MPEKSKRIGWIDAAKGVGMLCIVFCHATRGRGLLNHFFYSFHVPLFFFLFGVTYTHKPGELKKVLGKRTKQLGVPYLVFGIISLMIYQLLGRFALKALDGGVDYTLAQNIGWFLYGYTDAINSPLWFLPCLFLCTGMLCLCAEALRWAKGKKALVLQIIPFLVSMTFLEAYQCWFRVKLLWHLQTALILFVFCWVGYWLGTKKLFDVKPTWIKTLTGFLLLGGGAVAGLWNERVQYTAGLYGNELLFYTASFLSIIGICLLCQVAPRMQWLEAVGRGTMPILVMHKFPVLFFQCICPVVKDHFARGSVVWSITVSIVSVLMCMAVGWAIKRILPEALGSSRKRKGENNYVQR